MTAIATPPALPLSPPANLRDRGGIAVPGGITRPGVMWRADDLPVIDEDSATRLLADGLTSVIDLRLTAEIEVTGRGVLGSLPVSYYHVPFMTSIEEGLSSTAKREDLRDQSHFADMYISLYEMAAPQIVTSLAIIAHSPGGTDFHCAAGQDRTGVLAAALLLTLGAEADDIVADYRLTGANIDKVSLRVRPIIQPMLERLGVTLDPAARAAGRAEYSREPMLGLLGHLHATYSDPLQPLVDAGLSDGLRVQLRRRALAA
ncbi:tyrosine-protein phosphatase [Dietzia maris]